MGVYANFRDLGVILVTFPLLAFGQFPEQIGCLPQVPDSKAILFTLPVMPHPALEAHRTQQHT